MVFFYDILYYAMLLKYFNKHYKIIVSFVLGYFITGLLLSCHHNHKHKSHENTQFQHSQFKIDISPDYTHIHEECLACQQISVDSKDKIKAQHYNFLADFSIEINMPFYQKKFFKTIFQYDSLSRAPPFV